MNKHCYPCKECRIKMYRAAAKKGGENNRDKGADFSAMARKRWDKEKA